MHASFSIRHTVVPTIGIGFDIPNNSFVIFIRNPRPEEKVVTTDDVVLVNIHNLNDSIFSVGLSSL
jgi:hypothetical protein